MIIKIADFGLSVNIGDKDYYRLTGHVDVKLPLKWMALESLSDYLFSEMSDVVSGSMYTKILLTIFERLLSMNVLKLLHIITKLVLTAQLF